MTQVVVPVRYPLSTHSKSTLEAALSVAEERDAELTVLHVNLYQNGRRVSRTDLRRAVESAFGQRDRTRYVVRSGLLVEETILEEVAAINADLVIIGGKQVSRWRKMVRRLADDPDIERYLRESLDCELQVVRS